MDWEAVGASAELIGAVAIFVSLVYLGVQIRQNTEMISRNMEATRLAAFERNVESGNRSRELMLLHPDLGELFLKGCKGLDALDGKERFRFTLLLRNLFSSIQGAYLRQLTLSHDPEEFAGSARIIDELVANPGVRQYIERSSLDWRPEFRAMVEARLAMQ